MSSNEEDFFSAQSDNSDFFDHHSQQVKDDKNDDGFSIPTLRIDTKTPDNAFNEETATFCQAELVDSLNKSRKEELHNQSPLSSPSTSNQPQTSSRGRGAQGFNLRRSSQRLSSTTQSYQSNSNSTSTQSSPKVARVSPTVNRPVPTLGLGRGGAVAAQSRSPIQFNPPVQPRSPIQPFQPKSPPIQEERPKTLGLGRGGLASNSERGATYVSNTGRGSLANNNGRGSLANGRGSLANNNGRGSLANGRGSLVNNTGRGSLANNNGRGSLANNNGRGSLANNSPHIDYSERHRHGSGTSNWSADGHRSPAYGRGNYQQQDYDRGEMSDYGRNNNNKNQRFQNYSPYQQPHSGYNSESSYRSDNRHQTNYQSNMNSRVSQQNRSTHQEHPSGSTYNGRQSRNWEQDDQNYHQNQRKSPFEQNYYENNYQERGSYEKEEQEYEENDWLNDNEVEETMRQEKSPMEKDENSNEGYETDDEDEKFAGKPQLLREIFQSGPSYSEKMAYVAEQLLSLTMPAASNCGYSDFKMFARDFYEHYKFNADVLADYLGYNDFESLCLNAPEIVCLHTWDINETPSGESIIVNYRPRRIDKKAEKLIEEKRNGEKERITRRNEIEKDVARVMQKEVLPTVKELDFKYRLCQTLDRLNGFKHWIDMGRFKEAHEKFYDEPLKPKLYREMYSLKTNHNFNDIQKDRLRFEVLISPNKENKGLIYKLRQPLSVIQQYHDRLKQEIAKREQEEQALAQRVQLKHMAVQEFVKPAYGRKTPPPQRYKPNDFEQLDEDDIPFENTFSFGDSLE